jgi:hypothetical protein
MVVSEATRLASPSWVIACEGALRELLQVVVRHQPRPLRLRERAHRGIEPAHAVGDHVDAPVGKRLDAARKLLGARRDRSGGGDSGPVDRVCLRRETAGEVAEVLVPHPGDHDLVEAQEPVRQHHGMAQLWDTAPDGAARAKAAPPRPHE